MGIQNIDEYCEGDFICPRCHNGLEFDEDVAYEDGGEFEDYDCPNCGTRLCVNVEPVHRWNFTCIAHKEKYKKLYK